MKICSYNHEEIIYDDNICPICYIKSEIGTALNKIKNELTYSEVDKKEIEYQLSQVENVLEEI